MPVIPGLGWTFNTQAERYQRLRPGYVPELYEEIFRHVPLDETSTAVEVGIGGGQATEPVRKTPAGSFLRRSRQPSTAWAG